MASISKEKLQKMKLQGTNNCYVYNYFGMGGSRTPEHHDKRIISKSKGYWGALWKSSNAGKEILDGNKGKSLLSSTHSMESNANVGIRKSVEEEEEEVVERRKLTVPLHPHPHDVGSGYEGEFHVEMGRESSVGHGKIKEAASLAYEAVELNQVKVLVTDMPGFMQVHAVRFARLTYDSMDKFSARLMACNLKKEFDRVYGPAWHCIVGSNFGSFVTHSTACFLYFSMERLFILLFKTNVRKALQ